MKACPRALDIRRLGVAQVVVLVLGLAGSALAQDVLLTGGHVVDVRTGTTRVASVLVRDGVIRAIGDVQQAPEDVAVIDVSGRWIVPGLVELHTHVTDPARLSRALSLGITSTLTIHTGDTFLPPDYEDRSHLPAIPLPRTYMVGGRFRTLTTPSAVTMSPATPEEARAQLDAYREQGVRRVKIWFDDGAVQFDSPIPTFDDRTVGAIVSGARSRGMQVYFHALTAELFRKAVATGPTWMIHPIVRGRLTEDDVEALRAAGLGWTTVMSIVYWNGDPRQYARRVLADARLRAAMVPETLAALRVDADLDDNPNAASRPRIVRLVDEYLENVKQNTELARMRGLPIAIGSDRPAGYGTHLELELLRDAGFDAAMLLRAATEGGATALGVAHQFGTIDVGKVADLVVVGSNPLDDITNLRDVVAIIKGGRVWSVGELRR